MPELRVNMTDVAREAGVSLATVSRALRDQPGVGAETRLRIKQIAGRLDYVVSPEASRLSRGGTGRVAVVVPRINAWYFATMLAGIESVLREAELDVLIYHVEGAADRRTFFERLPARRKADAVVVLALPLEAGQATRLDLLGMSVVIGGGRLAEHPCVRVDDREVARQAVTHLTDLGHEHIGFLRTADPEGGVWPADRERWQGCRDVLERAGLPCSDPYVATVPFSNDGGASGLAQLLDLRRPPTAIFAHSDEIALAVLAGLRRRGLEVPLDMSVVGVDDHPMAELHDLTTVRQPVEELGRATARLTLEVLGGGELSHRELVLPTSLVVRGTTAAPASSRSRALSAG